MTTTSTDTPAVDQRWKAFEHELYKHWHSCDDATTSPSDLLKRILTAVQMVNADHDAALSKEAK